MKPIGCRPGKSVAPLVLALLLGILAGCAGGGSNRQSGPAIGSSFESANRSSQPAPLPESTEESETRRRARIRMELAAGYYSQRNVTVALEELRTSLTIDPTYAPALGMQGIIYMDLGDRTRAEDSFQQALRIAPNDSEINNNYGWYLCQTGRERQSIDYFERATRDPLYRTPSKPLHNSGICLKRIGDEEGAQKYFVRAFEVDPGDAVAMFNLAETSMVRSDFERARFYSKRLLTTYEPNAQTLWLAVRVERAAGNRDGEASFASQLRRRFPESRETSLLMGRQNGQ